MKFRTVRRRIITGVCAGVAVVSGGCNSVDTPASIPLPCFTAPAEFSRIAVDTLTAHQYLFDSTAVGFIRAYRWLDDGLSVRKVMVTLRYDSSEQKAAMTVISTIQFRGSETTVNYTESKGFPGQFRTDFYPLLAGLRAYCNSTLTPNKKKRVRSQ